MMNDTTSLKRKQPTSSSDLADKSTISITHVAENKLVQTVEKMLYQAQNVSVIKQKQILAQLFLDLSTFIEPKYKKLLTESVSTSTANSHEKGEQQQDQEEPVINYFYELISRYYYVHHRRASKLHTQAFHNLITNHHFPSICSLLFYQWYFKQDGNNLTLSRLNIFLKGANRLFWSDVENYTFKFKSLYIFLKDVVLLKKDLKQIFRFMEDHEEIDQHNATRDTSNNSSGNSSSENLSNLPEKADGSVEGKDIQNVEQLDDSKINGESDPTITPTTPSCLNASDPRHDYVIEAKKRDLMSLVAKYFFYYENRESRMKLPMYILQLADRIDLASQEEEEEEEYDELSQLNEVGGWASLFSDDSKNKYVNTLNHNNRRFSIDEDKVGRLNELIENSEEFVAKRKTIEMISDMFVTENIFLLSALNNETILVSIMNNFKIFKQLDLSSKCKVKLQAALYAATRPGPPNYPPRSVRHKAQAMLDDLFPKGRYIRFLMNTSFRVFHHFTWPLSILYWMKTKAVQVIHLPWTVSHLIKYHLLFDPKFSTIDFNDEKDDDEDHDSDDKELDHYYLD